MEEDEGFKMGEEDELGFDDDDSDAGSSDFGDHFELEEDDSSYSRDREDIDDFQYQVLTPDDIVQLMVDTIGEVNNVVKIPATVTRILLNHFKWNKEKLMDRLYDGDREAVFTEAHVISPDRKNHAKQPEVDTMPSVAVTENCEICCSTVLGSAMTGIECNHKFCADCWTEYLTRKIMEEGMGQTITCAAHGCDILVDDITVMKLVKESKVKLKYQHLITNSFVECNRLMRWCPAPDCPNAFKVDYIEPHPVTCICAHTCCFVCGNNWHDPVKCSWLKKWEVEKKDYERKKHDRDSERKKHDDDNKTLNWIEDKTKECPKCHVPIEKDGGCDQMVCRNKNCKADFCWMCLGLYGSSRHICKKYDEDEARKARANNNQARAGQAPDAPDEPERFQFYYYRHINHMQSLSSANKLYAKIKCKMVEMQQQNMSWIEVQFLKEAVDLLCRCRSTLMYTYVFAFYLEKNIQSVIFEENQEKLENATETLSQYLERDINLDALVEIKQKVKDKSRCLESGRKKLVEHVHEGYEKDFWEYCDE